MYDVHVNRNSLGNTMSIHSVHICKQNSAKNNKKIYEVH